MITFTITFQHLLKVFI